MGDIMSKYRSNSGQGQKPYTKTESSPVLSTRQLREKMDERIKKEKENLGKR